MPRHHPRDRVGRPSSCHREQPQEVDGAGAGDGAPWRQHPDWHPARAWMQGPSPPGLGIDEVAGRAVRSDQSPRHVNIRREGLQMPLATEKEVDSIVERAAKPGMVKSQSAAPRQARLLVEDNAASPSRQSQRGGQAGRSSTHYVDCHASRTLRNNTRQRGMNSALSVCHQNVAAAWSTGNGARRGTPPGRRRRRIDN